MTYFGAQCGTQSQGRDEGKIYEESEQLAADPIDGALNCLQ